MASRLHDGVWVGTAQIGAALSRRGCFGCLAIFVKIFLAVLTNVPCGRPVGVMLNAVGERDRVEAAYRTIHARLWKALLAFTGDAELASDAEAEAFAQVLRRGGAVDDVEAWVWRSAFRIASGLLASRAPNPSAVDRSVSPTQSMTEFLDLLGGLSAQQRACVALRYVGGYKPVEIGELLGTSAGTIRVQLSRAHAVLRDLLREAENA